jgi:membrane-bound lytic murein transglycosylase F
MPATWQDVASKVGEGSVSPHEAGPAIQAGAYYMCRNLYPVWKSPRPDVDRWDLARASYNAGTGSLLRAQAACDGVTMYADIVRCLPEVTGPKNAHETTTYVERIHRWFEEMARCRRC